MRRALASVIVVLLLPDAGRAQSSAPGRVPTSLERSISATAVTGTIVVDGVLDERAWRSASVASDFRQRQPNEGAPASERTEVRMLYDQSALYVGARMYDAHPDSIAALLARRDVATPSDEFFLLIDSYHDRRTGFGFSITPRGVQSDFLVYNGNETDPNWDAVWTSQTRIDSLGWTAEMRIPLSQLRFSLARTRSAGAADTVGSLTWGINFRRWISRRHEDAHWSLVPLDAAVWASHWGELRGVSLPRAPRRLEVIPYSLGRLTSEPGTADNPLYRRIAPYGAAGADIRYGLTPNLTLTAAVNPDFGQVEADPAVVNLGAYEIFVPERRPFFVEGMDIFRFSTSQWFDQGELFYSRRIGRAPQGEMPDTVRYDDVPDVSRLLGAAKLSGKTGGGWSLGVLAALTAREEARYVDTLGVSRRLDVEPRTTYAIARASRDFRRGASSLGAVATATDRAGLGDSSLHELRAGAYTGGLNGRHLFGGGAYELAGWLLGSHVRGTATAINATQRSSAHYFQRPDARHLDYDSTRTSLDGAAAQLVAQKIAGPWRWIVSGRAFSPGFEANDLGYQPQADVAIQHVSLGYNGLRPSRWAQSWFVYANEWTRWNFAGDRLELSSQLNIGAQLPNWWNAFVGITRIESMLSIAALRGGPALRIPGELDVEGQIATDPRLPFSANVGGFVGRAREGAGEWAGVRPSLTIRPAAQFDVMLQPNLSWNRWATQYVGAKTAGGSKRYVVGTIHQRSAAITARLNYTMTPRLSLQYYAQPFLSVGRFDELKEVAVPRAAHFGDRFRLYAPLQIRSLAGSDELEIDRDGDGTFDFRIDDPNFDTKQFQSNAVLRWEYRPGSALFLVWSQDRSLDENDGLLSLREDTRRLFGVKPTNVLLVKVSYWMGL
jgi:hypothetical protein